MTAKEMFEKLGYKEDFHIAYIKYYNEKEDKYIWFSKPTKTVEIMFDIDMDLLKAINKQIEELGWDNE
jgi:hypothetical protein